MSPDELAPSATPTYREPVCIDIEGAYDPSDLCQPDVFNQEPSLFLQDAVGQGLVRHVRIDERISHGGSP